MKRYLLYLVLLACAGTKSAFSQEATFKEIKSITLEEAYNEGDKILIFGERTIVNIKSWNRNIVSLKADIISRYKDKDQAVVDLEKISLSFSKSGKKIIYNNAVRLNSPSDKPLSNLKVEIEMLVPENAVIIIENHFGEINISANLDELTMKSDFTKISIFDSKAKCSITTAYGDVLIADSEIDLNLNGDRSNLNVSRMVGTLVAKVEYGDIDIQAIDKTVIAKLNGEFSPMFITLEDSYPHKIDVRCKDCSIKKAEKIKAKIDNDSHIVINRNGTSMGTITSIIEDIIIK